MKETSQHSAINEPLPKGATIVRPAKRAHWTVNSKRKQRVLIIADISGSMAGAKAVQALSGCQQLNDNLASSANKGGFLVAVIYFNFEARTVHVWTPAVALVGNMAPMNPEGQTNIAAALELALTMLAEAQKQDERQSEYTVLRSVVFFYSDGQHNKGDDPRPVAEKVKAQADVVTIAIGTDADAQLMQDLATSPAHAYTVSDTAELRKFLADAAPTITQTFQRGEDATQVLTQLQKS